MAERPAVLGLHVLVELVMLVAVGYWGWTAHDGPQRWVWAMALPLLLGTIWAVFRVPGDGDGDPIIAVPGILRLVLELAILGAAAALLVAAGQPLWAIVVAALIALDYALQYDRVGRLISG